MAFVRYLRQSTQATVTIGPVWATDNGALKSDLAYNASGINCDVYKNGTKADVSLSGSAGNGYFRAGSGEAQYLLTLSTGNTDTIGALRLTLSATGYYMPSHDFVVLSADVYDAMFGNYAPAKAGDRMDLVDAPNATAREAIRTTIQAAGSHLALIKAKTDNLPASPAGAEFKKNTAKSGFTFFMADSADHVTGKTGLNVTATRSLDGAAFDACANNVAEISGGFYKIDLAATDLNGDIVVLKFSANGADVTAFTIATGG